MGSRKKLMLQELLEKSEVKCRDTFFLESFVDAELKLIVEKYVNDNSDFGYVARNLLRSFEELKQIERSYLNAIRVCHSRIQNMQSVLE